MGNTESNVTSGVKKQVDTSSIRMYKLVDLKGGGLLVELMKQAAQTKQFAELDHAIKTKVEPFLYNKGAGKKIPIWKLVLLRNKDRPRHKMLPFLRTMEDPNVYDIDKDFGTPTEIDKLEKTEYREVCWNLNERGAVGETILHLCLLNATSILVDLGKRLLKFYPKLINDIYISDEYYGESVLHVAIVNEDPSMVKYLLDSGADFHERCFGNFMSSEDQKASRTDSLDHEWVNLQPETNYEGINISYISILLNHEIVSQNQRFAVKNIVRASVVTGLVTLLQIYSHSPLAQACKFATWISVSLLPCYVYWGEYPLSFAACLGQEECYRLILARGGNPDNRDTNGNTVLHMLVIHEKIPTFDMAYEAGADLNIKNVLNLTPLTLAAKLARIEMFFHILKIEREIYWQIGSITCAAYPLTQIDTIDNKSGQISKTSALNLVVFGDKDEHLELMDGVLIDLLNAKWNTFVKFRFYRQFFQFSLYFLLSVICFTLRPGPPSAESIQNTTAIPEINDLTSSKYKYTADRDDRRRKRYTNNSETSTQLIDNYIRNNENSTSLLYDIYTTQIPPVETNIYNNTINFRLLNQTSFSGTHQSFMAWWENSMGQCRLMKINDINDSIRLVTEVVLEFGALFYLLAAVREASFLGLNMFIENLMTAPSRVMFLCSCLIMMVLPFLRIMCYDKIEDMMVVGIMLTTSPYFLFFCRGFKTVGPFVVMIYRMIIGDLLRFVCIYLVFVTGFSQAYYIIFLTFDDPETPDGVDDSMENPMPNPIESVMAMFLMSMNTFSDYYAAFEKTNHEMVAKFCFVVFMVIVAILLVNMLIAMMGNTYQKIAETRNEWQRQWARIVLVVERGVHPSERLKKLMIYSQPMSDGRRAFVLRLNQTEADKEEMKEILEMKRSHNKQIQKLKKRNQNYRQNEYFECK